MEVCPSCSTQNLDERFSDLVLWIYDNRKIFNSQQYLEIMTIVQKATKISTEEKELQLNNYTIYSDDEADEADEDVEEGSYDEEEYVGYTRDDSSSDSDSD